MSDFAGSFSSRRLQDQIEGCRESYEKAALLLEGNFNWERTGKVGKEWRLRLGKNTVRTYNYLSVANYLLSIQLGSPPVSILHTSNTDETVEAVIGAHQYLHREKIVLGYGERAVRPGVRHDVAALAQVPNIGPKRASKLLKVFPSIAALIEARDEDVSEVEGIGPVGLRQLRLILGRIKGG